MKILSKKIDDLIDKKKLDWERKGYTVHVSMLDKKRKQQVKLSKHNNEIYVFSSVVKQKSDVGRGDKKRNLAWRIWRKNALKELIGFNFDSDGNLIGFIEQPANTLDVEELHLYISTVAIECDRLEYTLTGEDKH